MIRTRGIRKRLPEEAYKKRYVGLQADMYEERIEDD